jgi:predicted metal-dependent HD superfamily phosphohydrolase
VPYKNKIVTITPDHHTYNSVDLYDLVKMVKPHYDFHYRFYHNFDHIQNMIDGHQRCFGQMSISEYLAILYHDVVYDPLSRTNEENSVRMMLMHREKFPALIDDSDVQIASNIIMHTKHSNSLIPAYAARVVDVDLMILGSDPETYAKYVSNVRREYSMFSDDQWNEGRIKVLDHFLDSVLIFGTLELYELFEDQARHNMQQELENAKLS